MISRLQKQLRKETPRHSHGYVALSMLAVMIFAGGFIYNGTTNFAQAQTAPVTGSYSSPIIVLDLGPNEFVTAIEGVVIDEVIPTGASIEYSFSFFTDDDDNFNLTSYNSSFSLHVGISELSGIVPEGDLSAIKSYQFTAELSASGAEMPVVNSVELQYATETIVSDSTFFGTIEPRYPNSDIINSGDTAEYTMNYTNTINAFVDNLGDPTKAHSISPRLESYEWPDSPVAMLLDDNNAIMWDVKIFQPASFNGDAHMYIRTNPSFSVTSDTTYDFVVKLIDDKSFEEILLPSTITIKGTGEPDPEQPEVLHLPDLSINFIAKVEHGNGPADPSLPFYLYFMKYGDLIPIHTSITTTSYDSASDTYSGGPIVINSSILDSATYRAYLKTTKHLSKSAEDILVGWLDGIGPTAQEIDLDFGILKAGDISGSSLGYGELINRDDSVNSIDWGVAKGAFGTVSEFVTTLLGDFNNDGNVNTHDIFPFASESSGGSFQLDGNIPRNVYQTE